jgi:hypothetical protein
MSSDVRLYFKVVVRVCPAQGAQSSIVTAGGERSILGKEMVGEGVIVVVGEIVAVAEGPAVEEGAGVAGERVGSPVGVCGRDRQAHRHKVTSRKSKA